MICNLLARFASNKLNPQARHGVEVTLDMERPGIAWFRFVTKDDITVTIDFDFQQLSREYLDNMMRGISMKLAEHRKNRPALVVNATRDAVAEAVARIQKQNEDTAHAAARVQQAAETGGLVDYEGTA